MTMTGGFSSTGSQNPESRKMVVVLVVGLVGLFFTRCVAISALMLVVGRQERHSACTN